FHVTGVKTCALPIWGTRPAAVLLKRYRALHDHFNSHDPTRLDGEELSQQGAAALPVAWHFMAVVHPHARNRQHHAALQIHHRERAEERRGGTASRSE